MTNLFSYMANVGSYSIIKEQRTENREQRTENREQRTENREQRTENREQRTENRKRANLPQFLTLLFFSLSLFSGGCPSPTPTYTVTLDANGGTFATATNGSNAIATVSVELGKTIPITTAIPTRTNYTIESWNTKKDETGTKYAFGETVIDADVTLYAIWSVVKHTVKLNANGGVNGTTTSVLVAYGGVVPTSTTGLPTRTDYTLTGWNTSAVGNGNIFEFAKTQVTANIEIFAQWSAIIPSVPTGLTATAGVDTVRLVWTPVSNATYYEVYRNGTKVNTPTNIIESKFTDSGLEENTSYTYTVKACNSAACSNESTTANATTGMLAITVTEIPKIGTDKRFHYVAFKISANATLTDYTMGLVLNTDAAPSATALRSGASFVRTLVGTEINMLIPYVITSTIRTTYPTATQIKIKGSTADALLLEPKKTYSLYGIKNGATTVVKLKEFSTDEFPSGGPVFGGLTPGDGNLDYFEKSLSTLTFTQRTSDVIVFKPLISDNDGRDNTSPINVYVVGKAINQINGEKMSDVNPTASGDKILSISGTLVNCIIPTSNYDGNNDIKTGNGGFSGFYNLTYPNSNQVNQHLYDNVIVVMYPSGNPHTMSMTYYIEK